MSGLRRSRCPEGKGHSVRNLWRVGYCRLTGVGVAYRTIFVASQTPLDCGDLREGTGDNARRILAFMEAPGWGRAADEAAIFRGDDPIARTTPMARREGGPPVGAASSEAVAPKRPTCLGESLRGAVGRARAATTVPARNRGSPVTTGSALRPVKCAR
jgi:hypothetical protein